MTPQNCPPPPPPVHSFPAFIALVASVAFATFAALATTACSGSATESIEPDPALESQTETLTAPASDLSKEQSAITLKLLDDICGDTWCEGEYNWHFPKIACHFSPGSCTLTFRVTDPNPTPHDYRRSCKVTELHSFDDLVTTAPNGYQSLNDGFYDKVSSCIDRIEHDLAQKP